MAIPSILSAAGRLAGNAGKSALKKGASIAKSAEFQRLKDKAVEKAPGALWRAAGGHKVPILDAGFKYLDKQRIKNNKADKERKLAADAANEKMNAWAASFKQQQSSQARSNAKAQQQNAMALGNQTKNLENQSKLLLQENRKSLSYQTKLLGQEQAKIAQAMGAQTKLLERSQEESKKRADDSIKRLNHERQEEKVEKAKRSNRRRQKKAEEDGSAVLHKSDQGILMQIASDVRDIKGILAKGGFGGKGGKEEDSGGGLGSILGDIVGEIIGKKARGFILKGAAKLFKRAKPARLIKGLLEHGKGLVTGAKSLVGLGKAATVAKDAGEVIHLGSEGAKIAKAGTSLVKVGSEAPKLLRLGYDGVKVAGNAAKTGLPAVLSGSKALSTTVKAASKGGLDAAEGVIGTGVSAIARSGAVEKSFASKGLKFAGKEALKDGAIKGFAKLGGKELGKTIIKKIPLVGLLAGIGFGVNRAIHGDWVGAGLEIASGAASTVPGIGTAASVAIDAGLIARDIVKSNSKAKAAAKDAKAKQDASGGAAPPPTPPTSDPLAATPDATAPLGNLAAPKVASKIAPAVLASTSNNSSKTPVQSFAETLAAMLAAMTDEKVGIFVRPAKDALDPSQGQGGGAPMGDGASGSGFNAAGSNGKNLRPTLTPGLSSTTSRLAPEGSITPLGAMGRRGKSEADIPFAADGALPGMSVAQTRALAANTAKTESGGNIGVENKYGYIGKYQFGADALSDQDIVDKDKLQAAKKASGKDWYHGGQAAFLKDDSNWKTKGGQSAFLKDEKAQDSAYMKFTKKNIEAGYKSGALNANSTPEDIGAYAKAAHLKGAGNANKLFLNGQDSADANGTSTSAYAAQARKAIASAGNSNPSLLNGGQSDKAMAMSRQPTNHAESLIKQQNEVASSQQQGPIIVPVPTPAPAPAQKGNSSTAGVSGQMVSRNPDSSIRRLTDATMSASIS